MWVFAVTVALAGLTTLGAPTERSARAESSPEPTSSADEAKLQAQVSLEEGVRLFRQNDFLAAREAFQRALNLYRDPKIFFNLAQTERALGNPARAYRGFSRFLRESPGSSPALQGEAQRHLGELLPLLGRVDFQPGLTSGWEVHVDDESLGQAPLPDAVLVASGRHRVVVRDALGVTLLSQLVSVRAGEVTVLSLPRLTVAPPTALPVASLPSEKPTEKPPSLLGPPAPGATTEVPPLASSEDPFYRHVWFWAIVGGVLVATATTVYLVTRKDCAEDTCLR